VAEYSISFSLVLIFSLKQQEFSFGSFVATTVERNDFIVEKKYENLENIKYNGPSARRVLENRLFQGFFPLKV